MDSNANAHSMFFASIDQSLLHDGCIVFLGDPGSDTPHSVMVDGEIEELIDPPTFSFTCGPTPVPVSADDLS